MIDQDWGWWLLALVILAAIGLFATAQGLVGAL